MSKPDSADYDADGWWDAVTNESLSRLAAADPKMLSPVGRELRDFAQARLATTHTCHSCSCGVEPPHCPHFHTVIASAEGRA